ncbi:MAG TPA: hypothetical protein VHW69_11480 [Rhizomicrobium sp.]|nr:hypothetical protein [Rhizomicrobium sp.]
MPPIHADEAHCTLTRNQGRCTQRGVEEADEVRRRHFAAGHGELGMFCPAPSDYTRDPHVVGRVEKGHVRPAIAHDPNNKTPVARIATDEPVISEYPQIRRLGDSGRLDPVRVERVLGVGSVRLKIDVQLVDLDRLETKDGYVQPFLGQEVCQFGYLDRQALTIPAGVFGDLVVGDCKCAQLG